MTGDKIRACFVSNGGGAANSAITCGAVAIEKAQLASIAAGDRRSPATRARAGHSLALTTDSGAAGARSAALTGGTAGLSGIGLSGQLLADSEIANRKR